MQKIPTLFQRDDDRRWVTPKVTPGCEWVLDGAGVATRKYDGTCVLIRRDGLMVHAFSRREVKPGKTPPPHFVQSDFDPVTGKTMGWEPAEQSGYWKYLQPLLVIETMPGTYELCGPKVNGNPERMPEHVLIPHGREVLDGVPRSFDGLQAWMAETTFEGVVWWHPDGRRAKLKRRDFPLLADHG